MGSEGDRGGRETDERPTPVDKPVSRGHTRQQPTQMRDASRPAQGIFSYNQPSSRAPAHRDFLSGTTIRGTINYAYPHAKCQEGRQKLCTTGLPPSALETLSPGRNYLVALLEAYFDESYGPGGLVCVAGYVFTKSRAQALDKSWRKMLGDWGLPYFRMSSCAHGNEPFDTFSAGERIAVEMEAIALIHMHALHGVAATVDPAELAKVATGHPAGRLKATPYEFCVWHCVTMVAMWAREKRTGGSHSISYIFEAGDAHQGEANAMMNFAVSQPIYREFLMYGGHAFVPKEKARATQAADLLAWQWFTDSKRRTKKPYAPRKDLQALLDGGVAHENVHADQKYLSRMIYNLSEVRLGKHMTALSS